MTLLARQRQRSDGYDEITAFSETPTQGSIPIVSKNFNALIAVFGASAPERGNMKEYQVTCIRKPNRQSTHEHITHIGNESDKWMLTRESAIQRIDSGNESFFTVDASTGKRAYIGVVREAGKQPYLRTHADGTWNDNLLALPECSGTCQIIS